MERQAWTMEVPVQSRVDSFRFFLGIYSPLAIFTSYQSHSQQGMLISVSTSWACLAHTQAPSSSSLTYAPLFHPTFLICQHSQQLKRSRIREQVCSSYNALPVSSQRKVVVPYSLLLHPHCPLLDSPSTSHTCLLCYPLPHSLICWVPSGSTCRGTIKPYIPKKVCVKNYLLLQQSLLFVIPPTPSHSLLFPLAPSPARHCASLSLWSLISAMSLATSHFLLFLLSQDNPPHTSLSPAQPLAFSFLKVYSLTILFILIT